MLENVKALLPKKQNNHPSKDFFGFPIELGDVIIQNCNSHFKIGYVLSITVSRITISCYRGTSNWRKTPYVSDPYTSDVEELIETLKKHNGILRIYNAQGTLINLTKLNLIQ